jgi:hypothetical protein
MCHFALAAPSERVKRQDELTLDPIDTEDTQLDDADRNKRGNPEVAFQSKNAVLGFIFGKIDQFIDAKTRFVDQLDRSNIEKNKQHNIVSPQPIPNFQSLISAVITPKISAITQTFGSLSGAFLGGSSGGNANSADGGDNNGGGSGAGLGGIVSSVLKLSGPILAGSSGGTGGGVASGTNDLNTDLDDDDF